MGEAVLTERIARISPRLKARIAGSFYLITILAGSAALVVHGRLGSAVDLIAGVSYVVVTLMFYDLFRPVNGSLSLLAAVFSLVGFTCGRLGWQPGGVQIEMVFFGLYCLSIGYLIFRSTFLPRILGAVMACAGLAWLTFLSPSLADHVNPYNLAVGGISESLLTLWLLVMGVNAARWYELAGARKARS